MKVISTVVHGSDKKQAKITQQELQSRYKNLKGTDELRFTFVNANLEGLDFSGMELDTVSFHNSNLKNANFSNANLRYADFQDANLSGAILKGADLTKSILARANLSNANMKLANLEGAVLANANLQGANIDYACMPLCCASLGIKFDKKIAVQLLYHALRALQSVDDDDVKKLFAIPEVVNLANQFHRTEECGKIVLMK